MQIYTAALAHSAITTSAMKTLLYTLIVTDGRAKYSKQRLAPREDVCLKI
jgi:hypothetical protein